MRTSGLDGNNWLCGRAAGREKSGIHITTGRETVGTGTRCQVGTVNGGHRDRVREGVGKSWSGTKYTHSGFPFPARPDPTTFIFPTRPLPPRVR